MVGQNISSLCYVKDENSTRKFLVDTGAECSVLPVTNTEKKTNKMGRPLTAANGSNIQTYGTKTIILNFG